MRSGDDNFGSDISRDFAQFIDKALREKGSDEPSGASKRILFLIEEASRLLDALRATIADDASPAADAAAAEDDRESESAIRSKGILGDHPAHPCARRHATGEPRCTLCRVRRGRR